MSESPTLGLGQTPGPGPIRPVMPSLHDIAETEDAVSEHFMTLIDTWPETRVNILEKVREVLVARFGDSRDIAELNTFFKYDRQPIGKGVYGTVYKGCVRALADDVDSAAPSCEQFRIKIPGAAEEEVHSVPLVIKIMMPLENETDRLSGNDDNLLKWSGNTNGYREVTMGRLLNLLVQVGATPHLPLVYEPFRVAAVEGEQCRTFSGTEVPYCRGFAMELAHMSLANFVSSKIMSAVSDQQAVELLNVAVLQLCHGLLCAHKHYDFRHNDLHPQNAMMTFITDTTYTYEVDGQFYDIPNYGMCWKLIDFGYSASATFGEHDLAHSVMHSDALSVVDTYGFGDLNDYAMECYDMLRLLSGTKYYVDTAALSDSRKGLLNDALDACLTALRDISGASDKSGSLARAHEAFVLNRDRRPRKMGILLHTTAEFASLMRSGRLLETFFCQLAETYKKKKGAVPDGHGGTVFYADKDPFGGNAGIVLNVFGIPVEVVKPVERMSVREHSSEYYHWTETREDEYRQSVDLQILNNYEEYDEFASVIAIVEYFSALISVGSFAELQERVANNRLYEELAESIAKNKKQYFHYDIGWSSPEEDEEFAKRARTCQSYEKIFSLTEDILKAEQSSMHRLFSATLRINYSAFDIQKLSIRLILFKLAGMLPEYVVYFDNAGDIPKLLTKHQSIVSSMLIEFKRCIAEYSHTLNCEPTPVM